MSKNFRQLSTLSWLSQTPGDEYHQQLLQALGEQHQYLDAPIGNMKHRENLLFEELSKNYAAHPSRLSLELAKSGCSIYTTNREGWTLLQTAIIYEQRGVYEKMIELHPECIGDIVLQIKEIARLSAFSSKSERQQALDYAESLQEKHMLSEHIGPTKSRTCALKV